MNRYILTIIGILVSICSMNYKANACTSAPIAHIFNAAKRCGSVNTSVSFDGSCSYDPDNGDPPTPGQGIVSWQWKIYKYPDYTNEYCSPLSGVTPNKYFSETGVYRIKLIVTDDDNGTQSTNDVGCNVIIMSVGLSMEGGKDFIPAGGESARMNLTFWPDPYDLCASGMGGYTVLKIIEGYTEGSDCRASLQATPTGSTEWSGWQPLDLSNSDNCGSLNNYRSGTWKWYVKGKKASILVDDVKVVFYYMPTYPNYNDNSQYMYSIYDKVELSVFDAVISTQNMAYGTGQTFHYWIRPDSGWTADNVSLEIKDYLPYTMFSYSLPTNVGSDLTYSWDGKSNEPLYYGNYLTGGVYKAHLKVGKDGAEYIVPASSFTIIQATIPNAPSTVMLYTGNRRNNQPEYSALGGYIPSGTGGTFSWSWAPKPGDTGDIEVSSGSTDAQTLYFKPTAGGYVRLTFTYTVSGVTASVYKDIKVRVPTTTNSYRGTTQVTDAIIKVTYYHQVKDQYGNLITESMPCDEVLTLKYGQGAQPHSYQIASLDSDGEWQGGYGCPDNLQFGRSVPVSLSSQVIQVGGNNTTPTYYIKTDMEDGEQRFIWKQLNE
jgi:hypothetical protein